MQLPLEVLLEINSFCPYKLIGADKELDMILKNNASRSITRAVKKYAKDKKNYWGSINLWIMNRAYLTKYLLSDKCIYRFVPNNFRKKEAMSIIEKIKLLSIIAHMRRLP